MSESKVAGGQDVMDVLTDVVQKRTKKVRDDRLATDINDFKRAFHRIFLRCLEVFFFPEFEDNDLKGMSDDQLRELERKCFAKIQSDQREGSWQAWFTATTQWSALRANTACEYLRKREWLVERLGEVEKWFPVKYN